MIKIFDKTLWLIVFAFFVYGLNGFIHSLVNISCACGEEFSYIDLFFIFLPLLKLFIFRFKI